MNLFLNIYKRKIKSDWYPWFFLFLCFTNYRFFMVLLITKLVYPYKKQEHDCPIFMLYNYVHYESAFISCSIISCFSLDIKSSLWNNSTSQNYVSENKVRLSCTEIINLSIIFYKKSLFYITTYYTIMSLFCAFLPSNLEFFLQQQIPNALSTFPSKIDKIVIL